MKQLIILFLLIIALSGQILGQGIHIERSVFGSSGTMLSANDPNSDRVLGFTIGESLILHQEDNTRLQAQGFWAGRPLSLATSIAELHTNGLAIKSYPNPTHNWVNIEGDLKLVDRVKVYDARGRLVLDKEISLSPSSLDLSSLSIGIYQLLTFGANGEPSSSTKIMKQ